jgi:hypothetical protein
MSMRTPRDLQLAAVLGFGLALGAGLLASFLVHLLLGGVGRASYSDFNIAGLLEGLGFALAFTFTLLAVRRLAKLPGPVLLSLGLAAPPAAKAIAEAVNIIERSGGLDGGISGEFAVLKQGGRPFGVFDPARDRTVAWDEVQKVSGEVAVTELRPLLVGVPFVIVADGERIYGVVSREMYLRAVWVKN